MSSLLKALVGTLLFSASLGVADKVVKLTEADFDTTLANADIALVEFFAPWCGHCKALAPQFEKASDLLDGTALLASVDCTEQKDLCTKFGVKGFPTLKVFRNGANPVEYGGGRQSDDIVKYMKKQTAPAYLELTKEKVADFVASVNEVSIVGTFPSSAEAEVFVEVAKTLRNDYTFALVVDAESTASIQLYKPNEDVATFSGRSNDNSDITSFISAEAFPLLGEIGPENYQKYIERGYPLVWIFVDYSASSTESVLANAAEAAKSTKGRLSVVKLDGVRWAEHAKQFGLSGALPGIVIEDRANNKNYVFAEDKEITVDNLNAHLGGFLDGTLAPTLKSEPVPAEQNEPVYTLVGTTFDEIVMDTTKDVFVEFYAPWCGHCKSLAPIWTQLAESFKDDSKVVIAKIDATANDVPSVPIKGFPTLIFFPAGDKSPVTYTGDRTLEELQSFVQGIGATFKKDAETHDEL